MRERERERGTDSSKNRHDIETEDSPETDRQIERQTRDGDRNLRVLILLIIANSPVRQPRPLSKLLYFLGSVCIGLNQTLCQTARAFSLNDTVSEGEKINFSVHSMKLSGWGDGNGFSKNGHQTNLNCVG